MGSAEIMSEDDWASDVYHARMGVCGCVGSGAARVVHEVLHELDLWLKTVTSHGDGAVHRRNVESIIGGDPRDGAPAFVMVCLDSAGLIEHGGNIAGSWLTDDGRRLLAYMDAHGSDPCAWRGAEPDGVVDGG